MAASLPNGSIISIASAYGAVKAMSALSNASEGVATLEASHGVVVGDVVEITSGWSKLNGRIARAKAVDTNDVTLEGINTSSTQLYPAGSGTGSVREVSTWQQITQVLRTTTDGGEQQFATYSFLEDDTERRIPTRKSAKGLTVNIADDATLPHYAVLDAADQARTPRAIRVQLPNGAVLYYNAYVSFNKTPTLTVDEVMALTATLSFVADETRY